NNGYLSPWSVATDFTVTGLDQPVLLEPASPAANPITFRWADLIGAVRYGLYVTDVATGTGAAALSADVIGTSYVWSGGESGHTYDWTVWGIDAGGKKGPGATTRRFTVS